MDRCGLNRWRGTHGLILIWPGVMTQLSKVLKSRDEWRSKAIRRAEDLREQRKADRRHRDTIAELKMEVESLKQSSDAGSKKKR
jgi:hypothetical protein